MSIAPDKKPENEGVGSPYRNSSFVDNGNCTVYTAAHGNALCKSPGGTIS